MDTVDSQVLDGGPSQKPIDPPIKTTSASAECEIRYILFDFGVWINVSIWHSPSVKSAMPIRPWVVVTARNSWPSAFRKTGELIEELGNKLFVALKFVEYTDKPVRELSGGNQRKLAIALSFFAPSNIILLDEPTSSFDRVARHCVHELTLS
jgi:ABC-type branched-subunit amino acid transport system ATPase component